MPTCRKRACAGAAASASRATTRASRVNRRWTTAAIGTPGPAGSRAAKLVAIPPVSTNHAPGPARAGDPRPRGARAGAVAAAGRRRAGAPQRVAPTGAMSPGPRSAARRSRCSTRSNGRRRTVAAPSGCTFVAVGAGTLLWNCLVPSGNSGWTADLRTGATGALPALPYDVGNDSNSSSYVGVGRQWVRHRARRLPLVHHPLRAARRRHGARRADGHGPGRRPRRARALPTALRPGSAPGGARRNRPRARCSHPSSSRPMGSRRRSSRRTSPSRSSGSCCSAAGIGRGRCCGAR